MSFTDKYISAEDNLIKPDLKRVVLSNDAFAIGELLEKLIDETSKTRLNKK